MLNKSPSGKRRILLTIILSTLLLSTLLGALLFNLAAANPVGYYSSLGSPPAPIVEVIELDTDTLTLTVLVRASRANYIEVFVDGKIWSRRGWVASPIRVSLEGLSNGWHTLEVIATADGGGVNEMQLGGGPRFISQGSSGVIEFQIANPPPSISILSLGDTAVNEGDFQFAFRVVGRPLSWVGYSLDGEENVTVNQDSLTSYAEVWKGNLTLEGLSSGVHSLVVYAKDQGGNAGASATEEFTVALETQAAQSAEAFQTTLIVAASGLPLAIAVVGLLFYFKKRKR